MSKRENAVCGGASFSFFSFRPRHVQGRTTRKRLQEGQAKVQINECKEEMTVGSHTTMMRFESEKMRMSKFRVVRLAEEFIHVVSLFEHAHNVSFCLLQL